MKQNEKMEDQYKNVLLSCSLLGTTGCSVPWDYLKSIMKRASRPSREEKWKDHGPLTAQG